MNVFCVDSFLKEFSKTFKILLFLSISNDCSILRSKTIEEIYFRTIRVTAFYLFQLSWTHSSKVAALVWDDCKMPVLLGHEQLSRFFFFFSLRCNPEVIRSNKNWIVPSVIDYMSMSKKVADTAQANHGRKTCNDNDRPKNLQTDSHLWVGMHMHPGSQVVLHVPFFFSSSISAISFLTELKPSELETGIS